MTHCLMKLCLKKHTSSLRRASLNGRQSHRKHRAPSTNTFLAQTKPFFDIRAVQVHGDSNVQNLEAKAPGCTLVQRVSWPSTHSSASLHATGVSTAACDPAPSAPAACAVAAETLGPPGAGGAPGRAPLPATAVGTAAGAPAPPAEPPAGAAAAGVILGSPGAKVKLTPTFAPAAAAPLAALQCCCSVPGVLSTARCACAPAGGVGAGGPAPSPTRPPAAPSGQS